MNKVKPGFLLAPLLMGILVACVTLTGIMAGYGTGINLFVKERKWRQAMELAQETMGEFHLGKPIANKEVDDLRLEVSERLLPEAGNIKQIEIQAFLLGKNEPLLRVVTYD